MKLSTTCPWCGSKMIKKSVLKLREYVCNTHVYKTENATGRPIPVYRRECRI